MKKSYWILFIAPFFIIPGMFCFYIDMQARATLSDKVLPSLIRTSQEINVELEMANVKQGQFFQEIEENHDQKEVLLQYLLKDSSILEAGITERFYLQKGIKGNIEFHLGENREFFFEEFDFVNQEMSFYTIDEERDRLIVISYCEVTIQGKSLIAYIKQDMHILVKKLQNISGSAYILDEEGYVIASSNPGEIGFNKKSEEKYQIGSQLYSFPINNHRWTLYVTIHEGDIPRVIQNLGFFEIGARDLH